MGISGEDDDVEITHKGGKHGIMMTSERGKDKKTNTERSSPITEGAMGIFVGGGLSPSALHMHHARAPELKKEYGSSHELSLPSFDPNLRRRNARTRATTSPLRFKKTKKKLKRTTTTS